MKTLALTFVCTLAAATAAPDLDALIEAARAAPGEFAADALIRIAASDKIDPPRKIELLQQAFERASGAQMAYPRHATPLRLDGSAAYWNRLYRQDLDALSLRARAIEALLPLDSRKAAALFAETPPPKTPALTCADSLVYDVSRFYEVLGKIAHETDALPLLRQQAAGVTSAIQLAPMARVLADRDATGKLSDADFQSVVAAFAAAMGKVSGDDRSFTYSTAVGAEILALSQECKRRSLTPLPLLEAYRLYLVVNFSGARCADATINPGGRQSFGIYTDQPQEPAAADFVGVFNEKLRMAPLAPIEEQEVTPTRLEGNAAKLPFCEDAECQAFVEQFRGLVFGPNGLPIPPAERASPEWQEKLKARLTSLGQWKPAKGAVAAEYFREKSGAYGDLLSLAQTGPSREMVLRAWLDFLRHNPVEKTNRVEWFLPVNSLVGRVQLDPAALGKFAEDLRKTDDPLIALYANLEAFAPRSADRILPLL
jgi:hypothetical protein